MNSSELIAKCRRQLTAIEELSAKGPNERVLMEVARHCALANQMRWAFEDEHKRERAAADTRGLAHRDQIAAREEDARLIEASNANIRKTDKGQTCA
jgi:hypothetical protein